MEDDSYLTGNAPWRTIPEGIFPSSARPSRREGIFSEILATALTADPSLKYTDLKTKFREGSEDWLGETIDANDVLDVLDEKYGTAPDSDSSDEIDGLLPFHPIIAAHIEPPNTFQWGRWYEMLLTNDEGQFQEHIHRSFHSQLAGISTSNVFEELFKEFVLDLRDGVGLADVEDTLTELDPRRCYLPSLATKFQQDLETWSKMDEIQGSHWLASVRDLVCFYCMMYIIQMSVNLADEWTKFIDGTPPDEWDPDLSGIPFGIRSETAGNDREFRNIWFGSPSVESLHDQIYESWPRLAATKILSEVLQEVRDEEKQVYTLLEARTLLKENDDWEMKAIEELLSYVDNSQYEEKPSNLEDTAETFEYAVDMYYRNRSSNDSAAITAGPGTIKQLGKSEERSFIETRSGVGTIMVLNEGSLALLARTFDNTEKRGNEDYSYKNFRKFLRDRGIHFDTKTQEAALDTLESMGLIKQESDSGESVNVRTH